MFPVFRLDFDELCNIIVAATLLYLCEVNRGTVGKI